MNTKKNYIFIIPYTDNFDSDIFAYKNEIENCEGLIEKCKENVSLIDEERLTEWRGGLRNKAVEQTRKELEEELGWSASVRFEKNHREEFDKKVEEKTNASFDNLIKYNGFHVGTKVIDIEIGEESQKETLKKMPFVAAWYEEY